MRTESWTDTGFTGTAIGIGSICAGPGLTVEFVAALGGTRVEFPDNRRLLELCGVHDQNLKKIEDGLGVQIVRRGNQLLLLGDEPDRQAADDTLRSLYAGLERGVDLDPFDVDAALRANGRACRLDRTESCWSTEHDAGEIVTPRKAVRPRNAAQRSFVEALASKTIVFGVGPAGTGKTYLAAAMAVSMLQANHVKRVVLVRPAVEAGERLGFLPGDMKDKVDPYMRPLYDALRDFLPHKRVERLIAEGIIEIAPLAFMRGRTLSSSFVVLDEAQNTTSMQMRMFLTRLGTESRMAVTGDVTQIDLPRGVESGLIEARSILTGVRGIAFSSFSAGDVVRHDLVGRIIEAYEHTA